MTCVNDVSAIVRANPLGSEFGFGFFFVDSERRVSKRRLVHFVAALYLENHIYFPTQFDLTPTCPRPAILTSGSLSIGIEHNHHVVMILQDKEPTRYQPIKYLLHSAFFRENLMLEDQPYIKEEEKTRKKNVQH